MPRAPPADAPGLPPASAGQQAVFQHLRDGCNVLCDSVAGSGKTTCNLHVAEELGRGEGKKLLLLTYNSKLKLETREKSKQMVEKAGP